MAEMAFDLGQDLATREDDAAGGRRRAAAAPRIFKTHWRLGAAPRRRRRRLICVVREPADCALVA